MSISSPAESSATQHPLTSPIGPTALNKHVEPSIRYAWTALFVILITAAALLPNLDRRTELVALLVAMTPIQLFWNRLLPNRRLSEVRPLHDSVLCLAAAALEPSIWFPCILIFAFSTGESTIRQRPLFAQILSGVIGVVLVAIGALTDQPMWHASTIAAAAMIAMRATTGEAIWRTVEQIDKQRAELLTSISAVVCRADPVAGTVTWVSPNIERLVGWSADEWMSTDPHDFIHPDDLEAYWIETEDLELGREYVRLARHSHKDGGWVWLNMVNRYELDENGVPTLFGHCIDATELVAREAVMTRQARIDEVTGLSNRYVLIGELEDRLGRFDSSDPGIPIPTDSDATLETNEFALLMLDVDRFKEINDTLGHTVGDDVLRELATRISTAAPGELVCRLGGDEFAIVLRDPSDIGRIARAIGEHTSAPMTLGDLTVSTQVSIGSVIAPIDADNNEDLLRRGDIAMYQAKRRGQLHLRYEASMEQHSALDLELSAALVPAMENGEFVLFFQPKVDLATREIVGAEGLIRWIHPKHGVLRPVSFMHLVGLSNAHGDFADSVIRQAARVAAQASITQPGFTVAVNISMVSLFDTDFASRVARCLDAIDVEPHQLILEITESDIMEEYAIATTVLDELADLGVQLSIDDFGTGYSSFARLVDLPVSEIKIDRRFVDAAPTRPAERAVIDSIVDLARRLDLDVVAEGIESQVQADVLLEAGCVVGQGFLFSHAVEADELLAKIDRRTNVADQL